MDLIGEKVTLKDIGLQDTEKIITWRNKEEVRKNFIYQKDFTKESHEEWLRNEVSTGKTVQKIIFDNVLHIPIGSVYLRDIDHVNKKAEYGIFIGEESSWGKGFGKEATGLICEYAFEVLHLHKIFLRVFKENVNAIKLYEKSGFHKEAELQDEIYLRGQFKDILLMAKFNHN